MASGRPRVRYRNTALRTPEKRHYFTAIVSVASVHDIIKNHRTRGSVAEYGLQQLIIEEYSTLLFLCCFIGWRLCFNGRHVCMSESGSCCYCLVTDSVYFCHVLIFSSSCSSLLTFRRETKSHFYRQSYDLLGAVYSVRQRTSALSCATVLRITL